MADYDYVTTTGAIVADTSTTLADVQAEWQQALGADLDVSTESTPQYLMIAARVLERDALARNNALMANQINPDMAGGIFLDALLALTGGARNAATPSTVAATLSGVAGITIPAGSRVATTAGDNFVLQSSVTLGSDGTATGNFQSESSGAIAAAEDTLTQIIDGTLGWETVTNPDNATLGTATQSDAAARVYRRNTLGAYSQGLNAATLARLYNVAGVKSVLFLENYTSSVVTTSGITLAANSIYACVDGGTDTDVAAALLASKGMGCGWNGSTSVSVTDSSSGQAYTVTFDRPTEISVRIAATVSGVSIANAKAAILAYISGEQDNESGFVTGQDVSPWEIAGAINRTYPTAYVQLVQISKGSGVFGTSIINIGANEKAVCPSANISITVTT